MIVGQIEGILYAIEEISASAEEVSTSEQNSGAMEEQMVTIEEIHTVAHDLSQQALTLQNVIQEFKVINDEKQLPLMRSCFVMCW